MHSEPENPIESSEPCSELAKVGFYTCQELCDMALPGYPGTERGWRKVVEREQWPWREVRAKGGKKGMKRLYQPPPEVQALITRLEQGAPDRAIAAATGQVTAPYVVREALPGAGLQAETLTPSPELLLKAVFALMDMAEIPAGLTADQRTALTMRLFNLLWMGCHGDEAKLKRIVDTPEALKAALRLSWELYQADA